MSRPGTDRVFFAARAFGGPIVLRNSVSARSSTIADQVGGLFADQHARCVGVAANDAGHDGRVSDPQSTDATDPQLRVDHAGFVDAHSAGSDRVKESLRARLKGTFERFLTQRLRIDRSCDPSEQVLESRRRGDVDAGTQSGQTSRLGRGRRDRSDTGGR
jgi:hypothetical protein